MNRQDPKLLLQPAPLLRQGMTTPAAMRDVVLALLPTVAAGAWYFGAGALLVLAASIAGAVAVEWLFTPPERRRHAVGDYSALLTGLLLGLTLPPALPMWMAFVGGVVAVGLGKVVWGGLGSNLFNPALLGRAFLLGTFPIAMTTWAAPGQGFFDIPGSVLAAPFQSPAYDAVSSATPLGLMKFEHQDSPLLHLLHSSSCFIRGLINWHITPPLVFKG